MRPIERKIPDNCSPVPPIVSHCLTTAAAFAFAVLGCVAESTAQEQEGWEKSRFGRIAPHPGYWSMDTRVIEDFLPSGIGSGVYRFGEYTVLHNHGVYWSAEDNPDTSQDMYASVVIFKNTQPVFVARGYRYSGFRHDRTRNTFSFQHWTGAMGEDQTTGFEFSIDEGVLGLVVLEETP